jgi:hypothetical protein
MKKNMGNIDRALRIAIAAVLVFLFVQGTIGGTLGIVLMVLSGVFVLTSLVGMCPLYRLVGVKTCKS